MTMQPNSRELLGLSAEIHLGVKKLAHGIVIEVDTDAGHFLVDRDKLFHQQQVVRIGDAEATDLIAREVPKVQELGPGCGAEPKC